MRLSAHAHRLTTQLGGVLPRSVAALRVRVTQWLERRWYGDATPGVLLRALSALFGTALGMSLLMAALAQGDVGIVSTLSSMTPIVILPMVWIRTGVAPPPRAWLGALLAVAGTAMISL